ncbi:hypothetical protein BB559_003256 [Furculomyces boomerangus]|uniref:LITAF domain-containing protein n=2 Tax=Harpellales TaxID=61421 RepID=A0A2T9YMA6_9FUNG|nr:hypothetical protein BB559_003256 [Furculomyces boomerangus]PVZ96947.1 hypothetical protein BB558_007119 [Smittium angustum]
MSAKHEEAFGDEKSPLNKLNNPVQYENNEFLQRSINGSQMTSTPPYQATNGSQMPSAPPYQATNGSQMPSTAPYQATNGSQMPSTAPYQATNGSQMPSTPPYQATNGSQPIYQAMNGSQMPSTAPYQAINGSQPIYQTQNNFVRGSSKNKVKGVPVNIICPNCHQNIVTVIKKKNGKKMGLATVGTAIVRWPLAWIPLLVKPLKNKKHICPSCNTNLGKAIYVQTQNF